MRWFAGAMLGVLCATVSGQSASEVQMQARLDQVAGSYTADNAFMGTVLVSDGNQILLDKGYGMAVLEWNIPNRPDVKFRLGSVTKQFTSALVLMMQQDGRLKIEDPVSKYMQNAPKAWEKITIANLLGHTSGIPNFTNFKEFRVWSASPHTLQEELVFFGDKPLDFEPGSKFEYSNSNYEVLGAILEKVSGKGYGDLLRERIFEPLGMNDSGLDSDDLILARRAEGYMPGPKRLMVARSESMSVPFSAGSIYSTTGDLLKWEQGLFGGKLLSADSLKAMTAPGKGNYGLGLMIRNEDGLKIVEHGGGIEGFNSNLMYAPDKAICVVVLSNVNGMAPAQMGGQLLDVALGRKVVLASERKSEPIAKADLAKFLGVYNLTPAFALTIAEAGDGLTAQGTGQPAIAMMYEGVKDGHARFFIAPVNAEIEFVPDSDGKIVSLILHQNGVNVPAKKN